MSLKDSLDAARQALIAKAGAPMTGVAQVAASLGLTDAADRAGNARKSLEKDSFQLIVVGRFKNGKSTFLNALLGRPTVAVPQLPSGRGPMPTDDLPCTATLTSISYSDKPYVKLWRFDGTSETWDLAKYLREATVKEDEEATQRFFQDIRQFEVGFPAELCRAGVTMLDSPGLDDVPHRTAVTTQAVRSCDAAIVVYRHDVFAGQSERAFVDEHLHSTGTRVFTVVNLFNSREPDERLNGLVWNRLVKETGRGPAYAPGADLGKHGIYYVNAAAAEKGKLGGDAGALARSRLPAFEARLADFLLHERHRVHFERWVRASDQVAAYIEQQITQREAGLKADQLRIQTAAEKVKPRLAEIEARRARLPAIIARHRRTAVLALPQSFRRMVDQLRRDLPDLLYNEPLPSERFGLNVLNMKTLAREANQICMRITAERFADWGEGEAVRVVGEVLELLTEEIRSEVTQIEESFHRIQYDLTGWTPPTVDVSRAASMADRVVSVVAGVVLLNPVAALGGATVGWRGAVGAIGGTVAAKVALVALGLGASTIALPAIVVGAVLAGIVGGGIGVVKKIKTRVLKAVLEGTDEGGRPLKDCRGSLAQEPDARAPQIEEQTTEAFDRLETEIAKAVAAEVAGEEESIRRVIDEGQRSAAEKANLLAALADAARKVAGYRQAFKDLLAEQPA